MRMSMTNAFSLMYLFSTFMNQYTAYLLLDRIVCKATISTYFNYFRDILTRDMLNNPIVLGGDGVQVKI